MPNYNKYHTKYKGRETKKYNLIVVCCGENLKLFNGNYSHSIVPGGLEVIS